MFFSFFMLRKQFYFQFDLNNFPEGQLLDGGIDRSSLNEYQSVNMPPGRRSI